MAEGTWFRDDVEPDGIEQAISDPRKVSDNEVAYSPLAGRWIGGIFGLSAEEMKVLELKHPASMNDLAMPGLPPAIPPGF